MKDKFLIKTPMTVKEAKELISSLKFSFKKIEEFLPLLKGENPTKPSDGDATLRLDGLAYKLSDLEFIDKDSGLHFCVSDEIPFVVDHIKDMTVYLEKENEETEMNENEIAQNFVDDFEDTLSEHINRLLGDYKEIKDSVRLTVKDFCEGISKKETNEEDKSSASDTKCNSVVHPNHYNSGKYECIEVMKEVFGDEAVKLFCVMNAFKYLWRYNKKNGEEDVAKACNYLKIRSGLNKAEE